MKRVLVIALFLALAAAGMYQQFWKRNALPNSLVVFASGGTHGYLEPCDCETGQAGGLAARQTLMRQEAETNDTILRVDAGSVLGGIGEYERRKGDFLLRGMKEMDYRAVNIGIAEIAIGTKRLKDILKESNLRFVTCNVREATTHAGLCNPSWIWHHGNLRVGITGITLAEPSAVGDGLEIRPPAEALAEVLPALRRQSDVVLVLADAPSETLTQLAERFPEADAFLGSTPDGTAGIARTGKNTLFMAGANGKTVGKITFQRQNNTRRYSVRDVQALPVAATLAPAPEISALVTQFKEKVRSLGLHPALTKGMEPIRR